jgi:membrane protein
MEKQTMNLGTAKQIFSRAWRQFKASDPSLLAGAISFFVFVSLAPTAFASIYIAGVVLGRARANAEVAEAIKSILGPRGNDTLQLFIDGMAPHGSGWLFAIVGLVVALFGASRAFVHMQTAFNRIFGVKVRTGGTWKERLRLFVRRRALSMGLVALVGITLLASALADTAAAAAGILAGKVVRDVPFVMWLARKVPPLLLLFAFVTVLYRLLPDATVSWRDAAVGAVISTLGVGLGAQLVSTYLTTVAMRSIPAAAATVILTLLWLHITALVMLFGAQAVVASAARAGRAITPEPQAELDPA